MAENNSLNFADIDRENPVEFEFKGDDDDKDLGVQPDDSWN